ncbi:hypothetical protein B0T14DRAFT_82044 [Immersiella caudata]|uniref:Uncharacterized protein n=1 Tax=Immersiella caudata TaxID=314043 RepID=A0AA40CDU9_9PEZI|nr:hypothetical protein B0T14DRAFT_82044 [Immersiella caudata]
MFDNTSKRLSLARSLKQNCLGRSGAPPSSQANANATIQTPSAPQGHPPNGDHRSRRSKVRPGAKPGPSYRELPRWLTAQHMASRRRTGKSRKLGAQKFSALSRAARFILTWL